MALPALGAALGKALGGKAAAGAAAKAGAKVAAQSGGKKLAKGLVLGSVGCMVALIVPLFMGMFALMAASTVLAQQAALMAPATTCGGGQLAINVYSTALEAQNDGFKGNDLITFVAIAGAASGWNESPADFTDPATQTIYRGEWKIGSNIFQGTAPPFGGPGAKYFPSDWDKIVDANGNATFSYVLYATAGNSFSYWPQYTSGAYKNFVLIANTEISIMLATQAGKTVICSGTACGGGTTALNAYWAAKLARVAGFVNNSLNNNALDTAVALAGAESNWNASAPDNINPPGGATATIDRGEWQVESIYAWSPGGPPVFGSATAQLGFQDWTQLADPLYNAQSTYFLYLQGNDTFSDFDQAANAQLAKWMNPAKVAVGILLAVEAGKPASAGCPPPPSTTVAPVKCANYYFSQGWGITGNWEGTPPPNWPNNAAYAYANLLPSYWGTSWHGGIDIVCPGAWYPPVYSIAAGKVIYAAGVWWNGGFCGNGVRVQHNGYSTFYNHMGTLSVSVGQTVTAGQQIAVIDSQLVTSCTSGAHVHFQINNGTNQPSCASLGVCATRGDDPCNYLPSTFVPASSMKLVPYPCWNPTGYAGIPYPWYAF